MPWKKDLGAQQPSAADDRDPTLVMESIGLVTEMCERHALSGARFYAYVTVALEALAGRLKPMMRTTTCSRPTQRKTVKEQHWFSNRLLDDARSAPSKF